MIGKTVCASVSDTVLLKKNDVIFMPNYRNYSLFEDLRIKSYSLAIMFEHKFKPNLKFGISPIFIHMQKLQYPSTIISNISYSCLSASILYNFIKKEKAAELWIGVYGIAVDRINGRLVGQNLICRPGILIQYFYKVYKQLSLGCTSQHYFLVNNSYFTTINEMLNFNIAAKYNF